jgi:hypothetical protein
MLWAKRLFSACLALAFTGFGVVAAAPAHAHDAQGNDLSAIHMIALDDQHDHDAVADHHNDDAGSQDDDANAPSHGPLFHCHAAPAFSPVEGIVTAIPSAVETGTPRIPLTAVRITGGSMPPLRPPRTFL